MTVATARSVRIPSAADRAPLKRRAWCAAKDPVNRDRGPWRCSWRHDQMMRRWVGINIPRRLAAAPLALARLLNGSLGTRKYRTSPRLLRCRQPVLVLLEADRCAGGARTV